MTVTPGVWYGWNTTSKAWTAPGRPSLGGTVTPTDPTPDPAPVYGPVAYGSLDEARADLGAPTDANYVMWNFGSTDLETVFASLSPNDILVLPERSEPYYIDSSKGFMAAGVTGVDGTGANGLKDGSIVPIVSNPRLWFEMSRARRGIIGLGPGAVVAPSPSSWTAPRQPILEDEPAATRWQKAYFANGTTTNLVGAQNTLMGFEATNPFFANFVMKGRDFGGVAYSSLKRTGGTAGLATMKRFIFDQSWRSHDGVPNGEVGALSLNGGTYLYEHLDMVTPSEGYAGGSPLMWNNCTGGTLRHIRARGAKAGMWTFWRCGGLNTLEDCHISAGQTGMNIEENRAGFEVDWTGGSMSLGIDWPGNKFHYGINPVGGPPRITMRGVDIGTNAYTPGALTLNIYGTAGIAKRSYIACDNRPISCVPASKWID